MWSKEHFEYFLHSFQSVASYFPPPLMPEDFWKASEGSTLGNYNPMEYQ